MKTLALSTTEELEESPQVSLNDKEIDLATFQLCHEACWPDSAEDGEEMS